MTWVRHVTVVQERKSIHERMRSTGVDYRLGPWLLEGWREVLGGVDEACVCVCVRGKGEGAGWIKEGQIVQSPLLCVASPDQVS